MNEHHYENIHQNWSLLIFHTATQLHDLGMNPHQWNMKKTSEDELARTYRVRELRPWMVPLFQVGYTSPVGILHPPLHTTPFYKYYHWRPHWGKATMIRALLHKELLTFVQQRNIRRGTRMMHLYRLPLPADVLQHVDALAGHVSITASATHRRRLFQKNTPMETQLGVPLPTTLAGRNKRQK